MSLPIATLIVIHHVAINPAYITSAQFKPKNITTDNPMLYSKEDTIIIYTADAQEPMRISGPDAKLWWQRLTQS